MAGKKATQPGETETERQERYVYQLCQATMETDKGIKRLCDTFRAEDKDFPAARTIRTWIAESEEFSAQYARAKDLQADFLAEQIIEISDDDSEDELFVGGDDETGAGAKRVANNEFIQRSRLRVEARKWVASKLAPKKYGDKIENTFQNPDGSALNIGVTFVKPTDG
jgi:F420-dependent methylenetetrahydromethanopterin dehydrogenase